MAISDAGRGRIQGVLTEWSWRAVVALYGVFTVLRGIEGDGVRVGAYQVAQFGSIAVGLVWVLVLEFRSDPEPFRSPLKQPRAFAIFAGALLAFLIVAGISTLVGDDTKAGASQLAVTLLMLAFIIATVATRWRRDRLLIRGDFAWWVGLAALAQAVGIILLPLSPASVMSYIGGRFQGVFTNPNFCGIVSAIAITMAVLVIADARLMRLRPWLIAALVPLTAALYLSGSRTGLLAAAAGVALTLVFVFRRWTARVVILVAAAAVVLAVSAIPVTVLREDNLLFEPTPAPTAATSTYSATSEPAPPTGGDAAPPTSQPTPENTLPTPETSHPTPETSHPTPEPETDDLNVQSSGRLDIAREAVSVWLRAPVLGHGFRSSAALLGGVEPHNLVLQVLVETGALGVAPLLVGSVAIVLCFTRRPRDLRFLGPVAAIVVTETLTSTAFGWGGPGAFATWLILCAGFAWAGAAESSPRP